MNIASLAQRFRHAQRSTLARGLAAFGSAEILTRVVRIAAIVVIARQVSPTVMGAAALALSLFELVRVLANAGIGQRIIAESDAGLAAACNTAHRLFWAWCGCVAIVQLLVAAVLYAVFDMTDIAAMLAVLSGVYLFMPAGLVQVFLLMREQRFGLLARIRATQAICDHVFTLLLVLAWPSAWAIVLPKLLTAPLWLVLVRRNRSGRAQPQAGRAPARAFLGFGLGVLVSDLATVARAQIDKLVVGALFGVEALGIYYFAFNAGLGITTSFVMALGNVLFPYICAVPQWSKRQRRCRQGLVVGVVIFMPVLLAQVGLAHVYVPLIFGAQWVDAAPLVSVLGLGAIPMIFAAVASAWLRAQNRPAIEATMAGAATIAALGALSLFAPFGLMAAASAYVAGLAVVMIPTVLYYLIQSPVCEHPATSNGSYA
ncbi:membrane protein [Salinisphaera sp. T5B8]|uniref:oligosaccharide flippase family protein n=1 Tax=Salinisphaera sp. T5B8 TaxID=1304154 RepID=UPI00334025BA